MRITSPVFEHNQKIPDTYTCDGENISPPLLFLEIPGNGKSLVLIMDDPDAPNGTFTHWVVFNIDPKVEEVPEDSTPRDGILGMTNFGKMGYGGPCPPSGEHRYFFKLYALNNVLDFLPGSSKEEIEKAMENHIIDQAELIGLYSRI